MINQISVLKLEKSNINYEIRYKYHKDCTPNRYIKNPMRRSERGIPFIGSKLDYSTEAREKFTGPESDYSELNKAKLFSNDLQKAHFVLGSQDEQIMTHYQLYYNINNKKKNPVKFNASQLDDIKRSHFQLGNNDKTGINHYKDQFRWLQPIPAKDCET